MPADLSQYNKLIFEKGEVHYISHIQPNLKVNWYLLPLWTILLKVYIRNSTKLIIVPPSSYVIRK